MATTLNEATIVIVEDDPSSYLATIELLRLHGASTIHPFTNGNSAMTFVDETENFIDLFLVDIHMPGETGYDLVERIRKRPKAANARVVALTAGVLFDDIRRARGAGFDAFIGKPIKPYELGDQLERILRGESLWEWR
jgi:two-component system cell cycle response regulator DivK